MVPIDGEMGGPFVCETWKVFRMDPWKLRSCPEAGLIDFSLADSFLACAGGCVKLRGLFFSRVLELTRA